MNARKVLFQKGNAGRPKGSLNRKTVEQKERIEWVIGLLEETIEHDIAMLRPKEKVNLWLDLQEYIRPKLAKMEIPELEGKNEKFIKVEIVMGNQDKVKYLDQGIENVEVLENADCTGAI